jgi:UDP-2,3-diacylglucosamine pyrophosphatase LpxH
VIVVVSDLHLTDGASGTGVEPGAFDVFARLVGDMARHASHRTGGFRPLEEGLDLVLLGDVLDLLRSAAWPARGERGERLPRPWEPPSEIADHVGRAVDAALAKNAEGLATLRRLALDGALFYDDGRSFRVPIRITYFVGNHDWMLRLPGPAYDAIRARVVEALGLVNDPARPFPHAISEADPALAERIRRHSLVLRHGDIHDPFNFAGDRNRSAIGDGVVVEVLNRFPEAVRDELRLAADDPFFLALREVDNVRPFTRIPAWVLGLLRRFELEGTRDGDRVLGVWNRLGAEFFALDFVRCHDRPWRWDDVDRLEIGFRFVKGFASGRVVRATVNQLLRFVADSDRRFGAHALSEPEIAKGRALYVAYGHTHIHQIRPLAVLPAGRQFYFNSGTWRPTYRQTMAHPDRLEFVGFNTLTALAFYTGDERRGRAFEVWNGALAGPP